MADILTTATLISSLVTIGLLLALLIVTLLYARRLWEYSENLEREITRLTNLRAGKYLDTETQQSFIDRLRAM